MPNPFIVNYEFNKKANHTCLESAIIAMQLIKDASERWVESKKIPENKFPWSKHFLQRFRLFFETDVTTRNYFAYLAIIDDLKKLTYSDEKETKLEILHRLEKQKKGVSNGEAQELLTHILLDLNQEKYSINKKEHPNTDLFNTIKSDFIKQKIEIRLAKLFSRKNLSSNLFITESEKLKIADDISAHVKWAFDHIYSSPYPSLSNTKKVIARYHHGIQHVSRVALYIPVFANLYRKYHDNDAMLLTTEDIKLLQIAAVFHDSAREDEGVDKWDHESGIFLYCYLTQVLNCERVKAKLIAEATANKDLNKKGYFVINESMSGMSWTWEKSRQKKNIYQKLIHDADCLDIIRARDKFDGQYLEFYKQFGTHQLAFDEVAQLITEARSLIEMQGDSRYRPQPQTKKKYEQSNAYSALLSLLDPSIHTIICSLHQSLLSAEWLKSSGYLDDSPYNPNKELDNKNIRAALREGKVFARGIAAPSALSKKTLKSGKVETLAATEIRKTQRRKGISTQSSKLNNKEKEGNENRSVSLIGYGSGVFANAGFLIIDPSLNDITKISSLNACTGRGKKAHLRVIQRCTSSFEKQTQLAALIKQLKLGGFPETEVKGQYALNHVEILCDIKNHSAIYYSLDPNLSNFLAYGSPNATHLHSPLLQAIFLQNEYKQTHPDHTELPIFEYCALHNSLRRVSEEELSKDNIKKMWLEISSHYMKQRLADVPNNKIYNRSIGDIKVLCMYKTLDNRFSKKNAPADSNEDSAFQDEITEIIHMEKRRLINETERTILLRIEEDKLPIFSNEALSYFNRNPDLVVNLKQKISSALKFEIKEGLFSITSISVLLIRFRSIFDRPLNEVLNVFNKTNMMRALALAEQQGFSDDIKDIKVRVTDLALNKLAHIQGTFDLYCVDYRYEDLKELLYFAIALGLYSNNENLKKGIDKVVSDSFDNMTNTFSYDVECATYNRMRKYGDFLYDLHSLNLLSCEQIKRTMEILSRLKKNISESDFEYEHLTIYLLLLKIVNVHENQASRIKENVLIWLGSHPHFISSKTISSLSALSKEISLNDVELFTEVVKNIALNNAPSHLLNQTIDMANWVSLVLKLEEYLPSKKFDKKQLSILKTQADSLFLTLLSDVAKLEEETAFKTLIRQIYGFLKSDIPIELPHLIISDLSKKIISFSTQERSNWQSGDYFQLEYIYKRVPNLKTQITLESETMSVRQNRMM